MAVLQSCYIPWKGYFDILHDVDLFVFLDDVQYTKEDWRNRNRVKTARGLAWLTVPVRNHGQPLICEVEIADRTWAATHWRQLREHYRQSPHFGRLEPFFEPIYRDRTWTLLSDLNQTTIRAIARDLLGITTEIQDSRSYNPQGRKLDRLLDLLRQVGATEYVSGPAARAYIDPRRFAEAGIELIWKDYSHYPEYPQLFPPFEHHVSVLDLLFNTGPDAPLFIWGPPRGGSD